MYRLFKLTLTSLITLIISSSCSENKPDHHNTARFLDIASTDDPLSLDPRLVRDTGSITMMHMLFEGLMRTNSQGLLEPALADNVTISDDQKTYTFTLKDALWSDGTPLTAQDVVETWKSTLSPNFPAPNAYQFYPIKGAKLFKEGKIPFSEVGISTTSPSIVIVELDHPNASFLELTSCHFYFPVSLEARASTETPDSLISNGPFILNQWQRRHIFQVVKNPNYHDASSVQLAGLTLHILDANTALQLFKTNQLDWAGSPLGTLPQDAVSILKDEGILQVSPAAGTHWFRFNTIKEPFNNVTIRRAFSRALNRESIVDHVTQGNQLPASRIVPPSFGLKALTENTSDTTDQIALPNLKTMKFTLQYAANDRNHKIAQAVQQQWNTRLGIDLKLNGLETSIMFDRVRTGDYQIALGSWYADILDPMNFLEIFKSKAIPNNQTFWENDTYSQLLDQASIERSAERRKELLSDAEHILISEVPVAPLFHGSYNYLKNHQIKGVYFSPLGYLDFKEAYFE